MSTKTQLRVNDIVEVKILVAGEFNSLTHSMTVRCVVTEVESAQTLFPPPDIDAPVIGCSDQIVTIRPLFVSASDVIFNTRYSGNRVALIWRPREEIAWLEEVTHNATGVVKYPKVYVGIQDVRDLRNKRIVHINLAGEQVTAIPTRGTSNEYLASDGRTVKFFRTVVIRDALSSSSEGIQFWAAFDLQLNPFEGVVQAPDEATAVQRYLDWRRGVLAKTDDTQVLGTNLLNVRLATEDGGHRFMMLRLWPINVENLIA